MNENIQIKVFEPATFTLVLKIYIKGTKKRKKKKRKKRKKEEKKRKKKKKNMKKHKRNKLINRKEKAIICNNTFFI